MPGVRRTATSAAAFLLLGFAFATAESPPHILPAGTTVIFVSEAALDAARHEGTAIPIHLRDPLVLDGSVVAAAGTKAELRIGVSGPEGRHTPALFLERFMLPIGLMPVRPRTPLTLPIAEGAAIEAQTLAAVDHIGERYSIRIPFPFKIPVDPPAAYYTPTPARTAPARPFSPPRRSPQPSPASTQSSTPAPSASPSPAPSASP